MARFTVALFLSATAAVASAQTTGRTVPWLADIQQAPARVPDDTPQLPSLIETDNPPTRDGWQARRAQIQREWLEFLHPWTKERPRSSWEVLNTEQVGDVERVLLRYETEPGIFTEAYLLHPRQRGESRPGVVVFHSTVDHSIRQPAGVEGVPEKAFGLKLAQRGYVTLCPRNFLWPDNHRIDAAEQTRLFQQRHPGSKGMAKMLHDAHRAVDLLISFPDVDKNRIGAVGHSLGAKEVLYLAAFDPRVKVTVSSEGGIGTTFSNWDAAWYLSPDIRNGVFPREHHELLALIAPRPFLLIGGESADGDRSWPYIDAALPVYRLFGDRPACGLYNHRQGHAVPKGAEERIYDWFDAYLGTDAGNEQHIENRHNDRN